MPKFRFPLVKSTPTDSQYEEICPDGGSRPSCQLKVAAYGGASPPSDSYGDLTVVNLPLEPVGNGCETLVEVYIQEEDCPADPPLTWDRTTSAETINRDDSATIAIKDGLGPYQWSVSGFGFSLQHSETDKEVYTNTLHASRNAKGTARITVIDRCEVETRGAVRCTVGYWELICYTGWGDTCNASPPYDGVTLVGDNSLLFEKIDDEYKYEELVYMTGWDYGNTWPGDTYVPHDERGSCYLTPPWNNPCVNHEGCADEVPDGCSPAQMSPDLTCGDVKNLFTSLGMTTGIDFDNLSDLLPCCHEQYAEPEVYMRRKCVYTFYRKIYQWGY